MADEEDCKKNSRTDTTEQVLAIRASMQLPTTELERAVADHAEKTETARAAVKDFTRTARTRSISPVRLPKAASSR